MTRKSVAAAFAENTAASAAVGGLDERGLVELHPVFAHQRGEALHVAACQVTPGRGSLGQGIDRPAATMEFVVQVRAGREAGRAYIADHLPLPDMHAAPDA